MLTALLCLTVLLVGESALAEGSYCYNVTENATTADGNIAWICEQLTYRNALSKWKLRTEQECNISDAEEYWREAFSCPDFSAITCVNENERHNETDLFNCSIIFCKDGLYSDQIVFLDIWRQYFITHTTITAISVNKLIDCICRARQCLKSDAVTLEAWNSQSLKYSTLSIALLEAEGQIKNLENKSEVCDALSQNYTELSEELLEARELIENLNNQSEAWNTHGERYSALSSAMMKANEQIQNNTDVCDILIQNYTELSEAVLEARELIEILNNQSKAWNTHDERYSEISSAMTKANERIQNNSDVCHALSQDYTELSEEAIEARKLIDNLNNQSESWNTHGERYSELSSAMTKANGQIEKLQNSSEEWNSQSKKYSELSKAMLEVNRQIEALENKSDAWDAVNQKYLELSNAMLAADNQIQGLQIKSEAHTENYTELSNSLVKTKEEVELLHATSTSTSTILEDQSQKYSEISNLLAVANDRIRYLEDKTDHCPMKYNGKCFWIEYRDQWNTFEEARSICSDAGGRLANIYSEVHHFMLMRYLRMFGNSSGKSWAWLGMIYDGNTNTLFLSDGTPAPFEKWREGFPHGGHSSNTFLDAERDWESSTNQHLENSVCQKLPGAICET